MAELITIKVELFAVLREAFGDNLLTVTLTPPATVADLKKHLHEFFPNHTEVLESSRIAVNNRFSSDDQILTPNEPVAIIPPVSGG